jgi:SAM-dependent MidA family methyltransferase
VNALEAEIARAGKVTFARFMQLALYHPRFGYYTKPRRGSGPVGPAGDFLTAPTAEPLFAATMARLLRRLAERLGEAITWVELGAGEGILAARLLDELGTEGRGCLRHVAAVEVAGWARERLAARCPGVQVAATLDEVARPSGAALLFASELYDALPAHRVTVVRDSDELVLREFMVGAGADGALTWDLGPLSSETLAAYLHDNGIVLEEGQVAELRPQVEELHARTLRWCGEDGLVVVVEYGYPARQLYNPRGRRHGTLVGYRAHTVVEDVLMEPGEIDITAHVNLDDLQRAAVAVGWERGGLYPLGAFLTLVGAVELLPEKVSTGAPLSPRDWAALGGAKRLLSPVGMGGDLKALVQGTGRIWQAYQTVAALPPVEA